VLKTTWSFLKETIVSFIEDEALSRGAAIAFYSATSLGPVLIIVVAIAGVVFGHDAAEGAISRQLGGLMGSQSADLLEAAIRSASAKMSGGLAALIGAATLLVTASGVFGEMQTALNTIWKTEPSGGSISRLVRARIVSLGLVAALGFLLLISLVVSTALQALGAYVNAYLPFGGAVLSIASFVISFILIGVLFAAIYKVLPDRPLAWHDVLIGAIGTTALFEVGKSLIGLYIGSSSIASSYGAAGALIVILLWIYYSAQIFLLGAEFTKVYASRRGSKKGAVELRTHAGTGRPAGAATLS
jgi:membrane protein